MTTVEALRELAERDLSDARLLRRRTWWMRLFHIPARPDLAQQLENRAQTRLAHAQVIENWS